MTYRINKTDGNQLVDIPDGTLDSDTTSLTLIGRNVTNFGESINENFVKLLENFASSTAPESPLKGQIWYDTATGRINVFDGSAFRAAGGPIISPSQPTDLIAGDLWINNSTNQLYFFNGIDAPILVGPAYSDSQGLSGFKVETILDSFNRSQTITKLFVGNTLLGIFSKVAFTPLNPITGFTGSIGVGFTEAPVNDMKFAVTVTKAENILTAAGDLKSAEQIVYNDEPGTIEGSLTIADDEGIILGANNDVFIKVAGGKFVIEHQIANQDYGFRFKTPTGTREFLTADASTGYLGIFTTTPSADLDITGNVKISGDLLVGGDTVTINTTTLDVEDKNIVLGKVDTPTNTTADGGGIILKGTTDKTILYDNSFANFNVSEHISLASGKAYKINNVNVLTSSELGSGVTVSSLQQVGTLVDITVDNIFIDGNTISSNSGTITLNPTTHVSMSNKQIKNLADPTDEEDAATKGYTDLAVFDRGISMSMDTTGLNNTQIAALLDQIAPFYDPITDPDGVAVEGTVLRLLATELSLSSGTITLGGGDYNKTTVAVRNATDDGTENVLQDITIDPLTVPAPTITVTRTVKAFTMTSGNWTFTP